MHLKCTTSFPISNFIHFKEKSDTKLGRTYSFEANFTQKCDTKHLQKRLIWLLFRVVTSQWNKTPWVVVWLESNWSVPDFQYVLFFFFEVTSAHRHNFPMTGWMCLADIYWEAALRQSYLASLISPVSVVMLNAYSVSLLLMATKKILYSLYLGLIKGCFLFLMLNERRMGALSVFLQNFLERSIRECEIYISSIFLGFY